jgi:hypothetical protein
VDVTVDSKEENFCVHCTVMNFEDRNCRRLREFEEIEISRQSCIGDCE